MKTNKDMTKQTVLTKPLPPEVRRVKMGPDTVTDPIAYKVPAAEMTHLLKDKIGNSDYDLLGIQFEFNGSFIQISQIYYNASTFDFAKYPIPTNFTNTPLWKLDHLEGHVFGIDLEEGEDYSYYALENSPSTDFEEPAYKSLDCNEEEVDFVYFTKDQIEHLFEYYEAIGGDIVLSGCELMLAKKLGFGNSETPGLFKESYFSLKIEGHETIIENQGTQGPPSGTEQILGPGVAIGHPCPPAWYSFYIVLQQIFKIDPGASINKVDELRRNWTTGIYKDPNPALNPYTAFELIDIEVKGDIITQVTFRATSDIPAGAIHSWRIYEANNCEDEEDFSFKGDVGLRKTHYGCTFTVRSLERSFPDLEINKCYVVQHGLFYGPSLKQRDWAESRIKLKVRLEVDRGNIRM